MTKVYGSNDGVAPPDRVRANRALLPPHTRWIEIAGGNHSQFGRYGRQLFDSRPAIGRKEQERITRAAILEMLERVRRRPAASPSASTSSTQSTSSTRNCCTITTWFREKGRKSTCPA